MCTKARHLLATRLRAKFPLWFKIIFGVETLKKNISNTSQEEAGDLIIDTQTLDNFILKAMAWCSPVLHCTRMPYFIQAGDYERIIIFWGIQLLLLICFWFIDKKYHAMKTFLTGQIIGLRYMIWILRPSLREGATQDTTSFHLLRAFAIFYLQS
jgi:hypothetical protein